MTKVDYWATPPWDRRQCVLFSNKLDDAISSDHPVRVFDLILSRLEWTEWEARYPHTCGRPPIHPRKLASLLLYGLTNGLRSSRSLEEACQNQLDVMWLLEGLVPDHSTICHFRTANEKPLKSLFRQVCQLGAEMGLVRLNRVALDGTAVRANNGRYRTLTAEKIHKRLEELDQQIQRMLEEAAEADQQEDQRLGNKSNRLPAELQDAEQCKAKLEKALETLNEIDEAKRKEGVKSKSQLPETDPDSRVLPNKEGGFAPNYTAMVATDDACGFVVDVIVIQGNAEAEQTVLATERVTEMFGQPPEAMLADGHHAQGHTLETFENRKQTFYSPLASSEPQEGNPAKREDPTQPVPENQWDQLPYRGGKPPKLDKSAFVYVPSEDTYYCPQGRPLTFRHQEREIRAGQTVVTRRYQALDCSGCPLVSRCLNGGKARTIRRDQYSDVRERHAQKMQTPEAQAEYQKRMGIVEPTFGTVKGNWSFRQFLLRGLAKVQTEWCWVCLALNMQKLMTLGDALRAGITIAPE
jgi:transposase